MLAQALRRGFYRVSRVYRRFATPISLGCRALVVDEQRCVLLVRHSYQDGWYLPGGKVERGESLQTAVVRELEEECAIAAEAPTLTRMYYSEMEGRSDHIALFSVAKFAKIAGRTPDAEIAEMGFFAIDALPEGASPATRRRIDEVFRGREIGERW